MKKPDVHIDPTDPSSLISFEKCFYWYYVSTTITDRFLCRFNFFLISVVWWKKLALCKSDIPMRIAFIYFSLFVQKWWMYINSIEVID